MSERTPAYLLLLVASLGLGLFLLREPLFGPYRQMGTELLAAQEHVSQLQKEVREREGSRGELAGLLDTYGDPIPPAEKSLRAGAFYGRIEMLAAGSGLTVEAIQPRPDTLDESGLIRFPATVSLSGDTQGLVAFLAQLHASVRLVGIDRMSVRRRDDAARPLTIQVALVSHGIADRVTRQKLEREQAKKAAERTRTTPAKSETGDGATKEAP